MKSPPRSVPLCSPSLQPPNGTPAEDFEDFFEHAPVGLLCLLQDGLILRANATVANWAGCSQATLMGKRFPDLLTIGTRIFYETSAAPLLRMQGGFSEVALEHRAADGSAVPVFAHAVASQPTEGRPPLIRLAMSRASNRRRYEQHLIDAHAATAASEATTQGLLDTERETSELREQVIAVLGHDLRNPLASIHGGATLLAKTAATDRERRITSMMMGSVGRMSGLIDNLLDFARGRLGGGITLNRRSGVMLEPVLQQVMAELRIGMHDQEMLAEFNLTGPVDCDPDRIAQMISNLLGNALTHGASDKPIVLRAATTDSELEISIANGGIAIPEAAMAKLFQPFFRGEVRASQQGLGLGLHIASEIAKAHDGTLTVDSSDTETRFTFRMPLPQ